MIRHAQKKGLSTIVAAIFLIAIMIGGINAIMFMLNQNVAFNQTVFEKNLSQMNKLDEQFELADLKINSDRFNLTLRNTGSVGINIARLWVTNTTATPQWYNVYDLTNTVIGPGQTKKDIGQSLSLVAKNSNSYLLKAVTERGNAGVYNLVSTSAQGLKLQLFALPKDITTGQRLSVLLSVNNNMTNGEVVQNIIPTITVTTSGSANVKATYQSGPTPASAGSLREAETAFFEWIYKIEGDKGDQVSLNATLTNAKKGNWVKTDVTVTIDAFAEQSSTALQSLGLTVSAPDSTGTLHFHAEASPYNSNHFKLEPILPDAQSNTNTIFSSTNVQKTWITANSTDTITIASGQWNITMFAAKSGAGEQHSVNVTVAKVNQLNTSVLQTIWSTIFSTNSNQVQQLFNFKDNVGSITLGPQERIRVLVTWQAGSFQMYYDSTSQDTVLKTPKQTPPIPSYLVYSGGDVQLFIKNTGNSTIWIDENSRVVFKKTTTGQLYAGIINSWKNETSGASGSIASKNDSPVMPPGSLLKFKFSEPITIPSDPPPGSKVSVLSNPGNYDVFVRMSGYDESGGFLLRVIKVGIVVV